MRSSHILKQYLFSYLVVFTIPFLILGAFIYQSAVWNVKGEIEASSLNQLEQLKENFDLQNKALEQLAHRISLDRGLTPYVLNESAYNQMLAVDSLNHYKLNSSLIDELFLYIRGEEHIYSNVGLNSLVTLTDRVLSLTAEQRDALIGLLNDSSAPTVWPLGDIRGGSKVMYAFPVPPKSLVAYYGTVAFLMDETILRRSIDSMLGDFQGSAFILDEQDRIIVSKSDRTSLTADELQHLLDDEPAQGISTVRYNGKQLSVIRTVSDVNGWTYMTVMPTEQFFSRMIERRTLVNIMLLLVVVTGMAGAMLLSMRQYSPIRKLMHAVEAFRPSAAAPGAKRPDEWEQIHGAFSNLFRYQHKLERRIRDQAPLVRERLYQRLVQGQVTDAEEVYADLREHRIPYERTRFFVMVVESSSPRGIGDEAWREHLQYGLRRAEGHLLIALEIGRSNRAAFVWGSDASSPGRGDQRRELTAHVLARLEESGCGESAIGVGQLYDSALELHASYVEASAAIEYRFKLSGTRCFYFDELAAMHGERGWGHLGDTMKLVQSMKLGDAGMAKDVVRTMIDSLRHQDIPVAAAKHLCMEWGLIVEQTIREIAPDGLDGQMHLAREYDTLDEAERQLTTVIAHVCAQLERRRAAEESALQREVKAFIDERYMSSEFGFDAVAAHFDFSAAYLSKFFKEKFGMTFTDYVSLLRQDEIKRQLVQTDKQISEIVTSVGYLDVSNYIRKFKKAEGVTPGQYRKLYRQGQDDA